MLYRRRGRILEIEETTINTDINTRVHSPLSAPGTEGTRQQSRAYSKDLGKVRSQIKPVCLGLESPKETNKSKNMSGPGTTVEKAK